MPATVRVVLPAYNEAASLRDLIQRIAEVGAGLAVPYEILVVDDGSADSTASIAQESAASLPVRLLRNPRNLGLGATIARGLREAAHGSGPGDVIVTMDADLTQDPRYIPALIDAWRDGADVVIASRFRPGSRVVGLSAFRRLMTVGARLVLSSLARIPGVRDYSCGYRLYDARVLSDAFERMGDAFITQSGFACMVEILVKLRRAAAIAEVPFELHYDEKRKPSTMRIGRTVRAYFEVISDARAARRYSKCGERGR